MFLHVYFVRITFPYLYVTEYKCDCDTAYREVCTILDTIVVI